MKLPRRRTFYAYFCAAVGVASATEIRYLLHPELGEHLIFSIYYLAVSLAGWAGGFTPALVTALFSSVLANFLFTECMLMVQIKNTEDLCALVIFVFVSLVIGVLSEISLRAQARVREADHNKFNFLVIIS